MLKCGVILERGTRARALHIWARARPLFGALERVPRAKRAPLLNIYCKIHLEGKFPIPLLPVISIVRSFSTLLDAKPFSLASQ